MFDSLVYLDLEGDHRPGLATRWDRIGPTTWRFFLRKGVEFHNGEPFDSRAVKFTYDFVLDPANRAGNAWILDSLESVDTQPGDPYVVDVHTRFPDGMFLNRLSLFGSVCPPGYIGQNGMERFAGHPVGTGPYRFVRRERDRFIELEKNDRYWDPELPNIERVRFEILPEEEWLDAFLQGSVDFLPNLAGNQTTRLMKEARGDARILKRLVLSGYWVMIRNRGALADRRVRMALNHALDKDALVRYADFGNAVPLASLGKDGEFGANPHLEPHRYDPAEARRLLRESGVRLPLSLTAITADIALPVAKILRHDLAKVGVELDLSVASRADWSRRVVGHKILTGEPADFDLAINLVDNPIHDFSFHAGLFLYSESPWSLLKDDEYDRRYLTTLRTVDPRRYRSRLEALDRYIHEQALMVFTTQRVITAAVRSGLRIPRFSLSGHLNYIVLTTARFE